jgi:nitrate/nitrite transporter NarK
MRDPSATAERMRFSWREFFSLLRNRDLIGVLIGFFCFDYYWYFLINWLPSYFVKERHFTILKAGIYTSLPLVVFGICQPLGGWVADWLIRNGSEPTVTRKRIITVAFLSGLAVIPAAHAPNPNIAVAFIMCGCVVGLSAANQIVLLQACTPPKDLGLAVGVYNFVGNLAGIIGPIVTGLAIKWSGGSFTSAFVLAGVMLAASTLSYWCIVGPMRARENSFTA